MRDLGKETRIANLDHHLLIHQGRVSEVLVSMIRRQNIDLLILGTHGRGGLKKAVLGSVAEEVLRVAPCPALTVGPKGFDARSQTADFRRILFATDFGAAADKCLPYALALAENYGAKLTLLHMIPPMPTTDLAPVLSGAEGFLKWRQMMKEESLAKLKALIPAETKMASEPEYIAGTDFLPEGILEAAAFHKIDLIVMGADRTSSPRLAAHLPWSLTHEVICHAPCPVLTVSN